MRGDLNKVISRANRYHALAAAACYCRLTNNTPSKEPFKEESDVSMLYMALGRWMLLPAGSRARTSIMRSGYSSRILLMSSVPIPEPVPPPRECATWKPAHAEKPLVITLFRSLICCPGRHDLEDCVHKDLPLSSPLSCCMKGKRQHASAGAACRRRPGPKVQVSGCRPCRQAAGLGVSGTCRTGRVTAQAAH